MNIHQKDNTNLFFLVIASLLFLSLNSILCKAALVNNYIDAYSFTFFRLFFASITLCLIYFYKNRKISFSYKKNWISAFMLFLYAVCFSYSYISVEAGFGTLLLFGVVQLVMLVSSLFLKESLNIQKLFGMIIAFIGLIYLLYPSHDFDISYFHAILMIVSGFAWAFYSIFGKASKDALFNTMDNFIKSTIFIVAFYFLFLVDTTNVTSTGLLLAFLSGSITSGIGYLMWYKVVPHIEVITSGIIQLFVPVLAIIISVIFLGELLSLNLVVATLLVSLGIIISVISKKKINQNI